MITPHDTRQARARLLLDYAIQLLCYAAENWVYESYDGRQLWLTHVSQAFYALALMLGLDVSGQLDYAYAAGAVRYGYDLQPALPHWDVTETILAYLNRNRRAVAQIGELASETPSTAEGRSRVMDLGRRLNKERGSMPPYYVAVACFVLAEARRLQDAEVFTNPEQACSTAGSPEENAFFNSCYRADRVTRDFRRSAVDYASFVLRRGSHRDRPPTARDGATCDMDLFMLERSRSRLAAAA
jgi:hypothetical protein